MRRRIVAGDRRVAAAADDRAVLDDDRADRHFAARLRRARQRERFGHPVASSAPRVGEVARPHGRCRRDDRVRLDLDQHRRIDEPRDLDHRARGPDRAEDLAVRAADRLPLRDVGHVDARAHDVADAGARLRERRGDVGERLARLRVRVAVPDDLAVGAGRRRPETQTWLPTRTARE